MQIMRLAGIGGLGLAMVFIGSSPSPGAAAKQRDFVAVLNGGQENPPVDTNAFGVAYFTLNGKTLCYSVSYSGLIGAETAAHIHGEAAAGTNTGVLFPFPETTSPKNGCADVDNATKKAIRKGSAYVNIHTDDNPGGEIRGQIVPAS